MYDQILHTLRHLFPKAEINLWESQNHTFWLTLIDPTLDKDHNKRKNAVWTHLHPLAASFNCNLCVAALYTPEEQAQFVNENKTTQLLQCLQQNASAAKQFIQNIWFVQFDKNSNLYNNKLRTNDLPDFFLYQTQFLQHGTPQQWHFILQTLLPNSVYNLLLKEPNIIPLAILNLDEADEPIII